nr:hypothetical protein Iba_chr10fCG8910 [Ipomoea batatas]
MTDPSLGARVSTLCDHESPPIDFEAAIPIKGSPNNANTRTKAKGVGARYDADGQRTSCEACMTLGLTELGIQVVLGLVMTWAGYDIGSGGHECASSVGSASQANLWGQLTWNFGIPVKWNSFTGILTFLKEISKFKEILKLQ